MKPTHFVGVTREGRIPAVEISDQLRLRKDNIDKWLQEIRNKEIFSTKEK